MRHGSDVEGKDDLCVHISIFGCVIAVIWLPLIEVYKKVILGIPKCSVEGLKRVPVLSKLVGSSDFFFEVQGKCLEGLRNGDTYGTRILKVVKFLCFNMAAIFVFQGFVVFLEICCLSLSFDLSAKGKAALQCLDLKFF
ncbi:hypothetical protein MA16_Dca028495 [Dendrobium catenatum]|uniref:Uncharacterized protein n=1 Tax=Dendrobium catenatum TaxID=906689 RepID=A0A2I0VBP9_9ASPA|nr:hypothetical protein MA16_Dca028495 [Dendrobium catenatum]